MKKITFSTLTILFALTSFSQSNSVLYFDGVTSKVDCGVPAYPNFGSTNSFTFECWIKPDGNHLGRIFSFWPQSYDGSFAIQLSIWTDNRIYFAVSRSIEDPNPPMGQAISANGLTLNVWQHLAVTYAVGTLKIYVDGINDGTANYTGPVCSSPTNSTLNFGFHPVEPNERFSGYLDEVRISNFVMYSSNFAPPCPNYSLDANTVGLWHFNEGIGTITYDASANNNHGTITGCTWHNDPYCNPTAQLNLKVFIEGPYYNGQMTPFLNVLGHLPTNQPYNTAPWNYAGTESVTSFPSSNIVDWVLVDILKPYNDGNQIRFEVMGRKAGFLFKDGLIKDIDGTSNLTIETKMTTGFYIRIHHRNHLSIISAIPLVESAGVFSYDFTLSADQALGGFLRQKQLSSTIWGMIAADANASGQIDNRDKNDVWLPQQNLTGYYEGDFNMDTQVDMDDKVVKWEPNAGKSSYPVRDTIVPLFICSSSSVMFNGLEYGTVKFNNKCWLDRNLGASQVATAYNDPLSYGELFQWGRLIDGHQIRTSSTTNVLSSSDVPGHGDFIITEDDPYDWRNPQNNNLWQETTNINNPCPDGWNIPSLTQWQEATTGWTNRTDAFNSLLKLPAAGWRSESAGNVSNAGSWGNYWTTTINATGARGVQFDSFNFNTGTYARASGRSVRCLKTDYVPNNPPAAPSGPIPENGASGVETSINLLWVCSDPDGDDLTYNIYFGTAAIPSLIATNFIGNTWNSGLLNLNTTYYWKIVAYDIYGDSTQGSVWNFTTKIPFDCGDVLVDTRDGQAYNTVQIGDQCWMAENLNIGTIIQGINDMANDGIIEKYCYDNNTDNCDTYGGLYQWNEIMEYTTQQGSQGICPTGWHVPEDTEWCTLTHFIDPTVDCNATGLNGTDAGTKMKSTSGWNLGGNGTNASGFTALSAGYRISSGGFNSLSEIADYWSSTQYNSTYAWARGLGFNTEQVARGESSNNDGFSVRCVKDTPLTWSCGAPLNDTRDGQTYNTVQIGEQCWMAENLNIGNMIPGGTVSTNNEIIEKYCYNNSSANCDTYGGLYQWYEMMQYSSQQGLQGICPTGWHIPTNAEYTILTTYLGGDAVAGGKMKESGYLHWNSPNTGATNESGFTALPGGFGDNTGYFGDLGYFGSIWTSTEIGSSNAWHLRLGYGDANAGRYDLNKMTSFNVRCIKDTSPPTWSCGDPLNDTRDGQTYNTVQIGQQCWMAENLNIGNMIPGSNTQNNNATIEKYCYADNTSNCDTYGGLYQWNEMMQYITQEGTQGICPNDWHVPTDEELCTLTQFIDLTVNCNSTGQSGTDVGTKMKSPTGWNSGGNGTNNSGFTALPGGNRNIDGTFTTLGYNAYFWHSTEYNTSIVYGRFLRYDFTTIGRYDYEKVRGFSIRCIKDSPPPTWGCGDPLNDTRDGQTYNTVQIGEQCWMAENLNIGTMISGANEMNNNAVIEKYCYDNNAINCDTYGGLYQWNETMQYTIQEGVQGICPTGWHLPTDSEWTLLSGFLGGDNIAGGKMKEAGTIHWQAPNTGATNASGFTALPAGYRNSLNNFVNLGQETFYWSSTEFNTNDSRARELFFIEENLLSDYYHKVYPFSVRCIKDSPPPTWSCGDPLNDTRDGQNYNTVQIGGQCWMSENMNIGTMINSTTNQTNNSIFEKYCYDNNASNCVTYGGLYQWNELMNYSTIESSKGICTNGWHVPSDLEWFSMSNYLDPTVNNILLQSWQGTNIGTQLLQGGSSGFEALLSGYFWNTSGFLAINVGSYFYTSTIDPYNTDNSWFRRLDAGNPQIYKNGCVKEVGIAVRCVKD